MKTTRELLIERMGNDINIFSPKGVDIMVEIIEEIAEHKVKTCNKPQVSVRYAKCPVCNDKITIRSGDPHWSGKGVHFIESKRCSGTYSVDISEEEYNER